MHCFDYDYPGEFTLESGHTFDRLHIRYHLSSLKPDANKPIVWICHALTANSDPSAWWPGLVGPGRLYDPEKYFIVCANILGSSYGSTSPLQPRPDTGKPWLDNFPLVSVRDWARAHELLRVHLGIGRIHTLIGGSIGGFQAMEWAIINPEVTEHLILLVSSYYANPWSIAITEAARMAMEADPGFFSGDPEGGKAGLAAARAIGMLSFRGYEAFLHTQSEDNNEKLSGFRAASYQRYQGKKLVERFHAHCFHAITRSHDTHNVGRGRGGAAGALSRIRAKSLVIGIKNDILFPECEQRALSEMIPGARLEMIESLYGHDGFLIETQAVEKSINGFCEARP